jgi:hypothetical protein
MIMLSTAGAAIGLVPLSLVPSTRLLEDATHWQAEQQFSLLVALSQSSVFMRLHEDQISASCLC